MVRTRVLLSLCIIYLGFCGSLFSLDNVSIRIIPNEFPKDISWELQDGSYNTIVKQSLDECTPFISCQSDFLFTPFDCYRFIITDSNFDLEADPVNFEILFNGKIVISRFLTEELFIGSFACETGAICEVPTIIDSDAESVLWPPVANYWFSFTPDETGLFQLMNCDLNEQRRYPPTKLWVYEDCQKDLLGGPEGAIAFSEKLSFCPPSSGLNAIILTEGEDYLFRLSLLDTTAWRDSIEMTISQFDQNPGCTDPAACNYYPFATSDDGSCYYDECAPDLEIDQFVFENSILFDSIQQNDNCLIAEGCLRGPGMRYIIRFSTLIKNVGDADYIIGSPEENLSSFSNDNCHQHYHHLGYAEYLLFAGDGRGEPIGFKNGFCVQDSDCPASLQRYYCNYMGITAGCEDLYGNDIQCQWVDITDVPEGKYTLVARINWNQLADIRGYNEATYENNWAQVCVNITRDSGIPQIEIIDGDCPAYTDCLGMMFGQTEVDCDNVCGGNSHFADIDENGEIGDNDIQEYLNSLAEDWLPAKPCFDLNRDDDISIYDVLLAAQCLEEERRNKDNIFHQHCTLPAGQFEERDSLRLSILEIDTLSKSLLVAYTSLQRNIVSLQFEFEGIVINQIEMEGSSRFQSHNETEVFIYNRSSVLKRNLTPEVFIRIYYSSIDLDGVCITDVEAINDLLQEVVAYSGYQTDCSFLTNAKDHAEDVGLKAFPIPASDKLFLEWEKSNISNIQIVNVDGMVLMSQDVRYDNNTFFNVSSLARGLYVIQLITTDQVVSIQKIVLQ